MDNPAAASADNELFWLDAADLRTGAYSFHIALVDGAGGDLTVWQPETDTDVSVRILRAAEPAPMEGWGMAKGNPGEIQS